ncbi:MAG: hypothetical protein ACREPQ_02655 [Rhodanobacter sp.]
MNTNDTRAYFLQLGYLLEKSVTGEWTFSVLGTEGSPTCAWGDVPTRTFKNVSEVWAAWQSWIHDKWCAESIKEWLRKKQANASPADLEHIKEWLEGNVVRLPQHLQDDLDFQIIYGMALPRNWRALAVKLSVF